MKYTAAHWGAYQFTPGNDTLTPIAGDDAPSRIGKGWVSAARNTQARVLTPAVRSGWLRGDKGAGRANDTFVQVSWEQILDLTAQEIGRVTETYGNTAIYGGSYGWSSAGRFHHAQSQMRRFLNTVGGFVSSRETYSHAAAEVLWPHIIGMSNKTFQDQMTALPMVEDHCEIVLAFGGLSARTAQVAGAGTTNHEIGGWVRRMQDKGVRVISISPERGEALGDWWAIRPGTDTALVLALIYEVVALGKADEAFLSRCTSGWDTLRQYVTGQSDGVAKSADWAAGICDLPAQAIRDLALQLTQRPSLVSMTWGMQRADHGEQPIWAGLALACVLGHIGKPGLGYAFGYGCTTPVGRPTRLINWPSLPQGQNPVQDYIPVARIADMLLQPGEDYAYNGAIRQYPDIRLVWWSGGNPFHHHQDLRRLEQAWSRPETVIVNEHSWTATARRADIVLPATTPLERSDIMMNRRDTTLLYMSELFAPLGHARNDYDILSDLSQRMGTEDTFTEDRNAEDWQRDIWQRSCDVATANGFTLPNWDSFRATGRFDVPDAADARVAFEGFVADPLAQPLGTETGKITLTNHGIAAMSLPDCAGHPSWLPPVEGAPLAEGQFHLISGQPDTRLHAQNDQGSEAAKDKVQGREACGIHPHVAARLGVSEGDVVRLWNARGACLAGVRLIEGMRLDCISLPTGAWYDPQVVDGAYLEVHGNPNALTIDKGCSGLSQGNIAHTTVVRAEKWTNPLPQLSITTPPTFEAPDGVMAEISSDSKT